MLEAPTAPRGQTEVALPVASLTSGAVGVSSDDAAVSWFDGGVTVTGFAALVAVLTGLLLVLRRRTRDEDEDEAAQA